MKFSNFLFPMADTPEDDERIIDETLAEAKLCDDLGMEALWLAEHHFDGNCAYVDPVSFAAALATNPHGGTDVDDRQPVEGPPDRRSRPRHRI